jgi:hypothetical protein
MEYAGEYNALAAQREQMAAARDMRAKNALLMRQAQQEFDDDQAVRRTLSGLAPTATADDRMSALRATGLPGALKQADALQAAQLKAQQDQASLGKTKAETDKLKAEQATKIHGEIKKGLGFVFSNPSREAAESAIGQIEQMFGVPMDSYRQQIANLQTPDQFKLWAAGHSIDADKQLTSFTTRNTGGSTDTLAQNQVLGTVKVANSTRNTQSPDNAATVATQIRGQNMTDSRAREAIAEQRRANASVYDPERGVIVNKATGQVIPAYQDGKPIGAKEKPLNDTQSKALLFGSRMQEADKIIGDIAESGVNRPGNIKTAVESVPLVGGALGSIFNFTQSSAQQGVEQSKRDFINAVLRRESGAAIAASEFDSADKQYFPQIGDSDEVIEQKALNRQLAIQGIMAEVPSGRELPKRPRKPAADSDVDALVNKYRSK